MHHRDSGIASALFSIGQTCEMCGVTPRTLRYYEKIGLIKPDRVNHANGYRYYGFATMERIQFIRYYHEEGFSLTTIGEMLDSRQYSRLVDFYQAQIRQTEEEILASQKKLYNLKNIFALVLEAKRAVEHQDEDVKTRFIPEQTCLRFDFSTMTSKQMDQEYVKNMYYTSIGSKSEELSMVDMVSTYNVLYSSIQERLDGKYNTVCVLQPLFSEPERSSRITVFGGFTAVSCYHIGDLDRVEETYQKMMRWAEAHRYQLEGSVIERPIWYAYTEKENELVTEILFPTRMEEEDDSRINAVRSEIGYF